MNEIIERIEAFIRERERISGAPDIVTMTNRAELRLSDLRSVAAALRAEARR